ncbi:TetR/AcrR family transcriptional regulator [Sulfurimonas sp. CS5]
MLDAYNELFYKNGYASTSFSDIENITGLSKGNITYHFKNKQSILEGII